MEHEFCAASAQPVLIADRAQVFDYTQVYSSVTESSLSNRSRDPLSRPRASRRLVLITRRLCPFADDVISGDLAQISSAETYPPCRDISSCVAHPSQFHARRHRHFRRKFIRQIRPSQKILFCTTILARCKRRICLHIKLRSKKR